MRMLKVELKRIIMSKRSMITMLVGVCLAALLAVAPILFVGANVYNDDGSVQELNGIDAIKYWRNIKSPFDGEVTPDKLKTALSSYKNCVEIYGDPDRGDVPGDVYLSQISPIGDLLRLIPITYSELTNGILVPRDIASINPSELDTFYKACDERLENVINVDRELESTDQGAISLYSKVTRPFVLYAGYSRDAFDYLCLSILFLVVIGVVLSAPLFSENYESGADHILRCTKNGRGKLARTKIIANTIPCVFMYILGVTIHLLISDLSFGTITLKTSVQALYDTISLPNLNLFQLQLAVAFAGLLTLLSANAFAYFLSAKLKQVAGTVTISLLITFAPIFIYTVLGNNWVSSILPTGGVGLSNNFLMQLVDFRFLHLGSHSFWTPQVTMLFTIVWIPVFLILAVRSYCKHKI